MRYGRALMFTGWAMAKVATKTERLEARVTPAQKARIQRAADLEGRTLTDYVVTHLEAQAERTIREHEVITLSPRDSELFYNTLMNPPAPNEKLRAAFKRYREMLGE
jgi:uncharacterized protein (DUF1778 family)